MASERGLREADWIVDHQSYGLEKEIVASDRALAGRAEPGMRPASRPPSDRDHASVGSPARVPKTGNDRSNRRASGTRVRGSGVGECGGGPNRLPPAVPLPDSCAVTGERA